MAFARHILTAAASALSNRQLTEPPDFATLAAEAAGALLPQDAGLDATEDSQIRWALAMEDEVGRERYGHISFGQAGAAAP